MVICFSSIVEPTNLRFLPWSQTPFSQRSGFPNITAFALCYGFTIFNSLAMLSLSAVGISTGRISSIASFTLSFLIFIISALTVVFRVMAEKIFLLDITSISREDLVSKEIELENMSKKLQELENEKERTEQEKLAFQKHLEETRLQLAKQRMALDLRDIEIEKMREARRLALEASNKLKEYETSVEFAGKYIYVLNTQLD